VEPHCTVVGIPARVVRRRDPNAGASAADDFDSADTADAHEQMTCGRGSE
jgi:serine acetyltransferase